MSNHRARTWDHRGNKSLDPKRILYVGKMMSLQIMFSCSVTSVNACWKEMNIQSVTAMPQAFREYIFLHLNLGVVGRRRARLHWRLGLLGDNVMIECGILQYFRLIYRAVRLGLELYEQWKAAQSALLQAAGQVS